jgi:hypothetical protein
MTMIKMVNLKKAIKSVEVKYIKKYDGYCEVVREGNQVTTTLLDEEGQKYHTKISAMKGTKIGGCIVCGCDFSSGLFTHDSCNNDEQLTK